MDLIPVKTQVSCPGGWGGGECLSSLVLPERDTAGEGTCSTAGGPDLVETRGQEVMSS